MEVSCVNSFQAQDIPLCIYIPWDGNKNVECPHCNELTKLRINKYYCRGVSHVHVDVKLTYVVEIAYVQCQSCLHHFGIRPPGIVPYKRMTQRAIDIIVESHDSDDISISQLKARIERDFHLEISEKTLGTLINENVKKSLPFKPDNGIKFSGVICIDGMHGKTNGVKEVTIFAIDTITSVTFQGQIRSSESTDNIHGFLKDLKEALPCDPFLIITDFVEWDEKIKEVFPNTLHQKCHFHFMKHLTKGIRKEVSAYLTRYYGNEIKELKEISRQTLESEKQEVPHEITITPHSRDGTIAVTLANQVLGIATTAPSKREHEIERFISTATNSGEEMLQVLGEAVSTKKPRLVNGTHGEATFIAFSFRIIRKWLRKKRLKLEEKRKRVRDIRYLHVKTKLTKEEHEKLHVILHAHPFLLELRTLLNDTRDALRRYSYEAGLEKIATISAKAKYGSELKSALKLLHNNAEKLLSYKKLKIDAPETRLRVNNEWMMRKGRRIIKLRHGLKSLAKKAHLLSKKYQIEIQIRMEKQNQNR